MSIFYTVRPCDTGHFGLVDRDDDDDDYIPEYSDLIELQPRGTRPQNHTVLVRVCKKVQESLNDTQTTGNKTVCHLRRVPVTPKKSNNVTEEEIPEDVLEELEKNWNGTLSQNSDAGGKTSVRKSRQAERNWTDGDDSSGASEEDAIGIHISGEYMENKTNTVVEVKSVERIEIQREKSKSKADEVSEEDNEILLNSDPLWKLLPLEPGIIKKIEETVLRNDIQVHPEPHTVLSLDKNNTAENNNTSQIDLSLDEYDYDYSDQVPCLSAVSLQVKCQMLFHLTCSTL